MGETPAQKAARADAVERMRQKFETYNESENGVGLSLERFAPNVLYGQYRDERTQRSFEHYCAGLSAAGERVRELERVLDEIASKAHDSVLNFVGYKANNKPVLMAFADIRNMARSALAPPVDAPGKDEHE